MEKNNGTTEKTKDELYVKSYEEKTKDTAFWYGIAFGLSTALTLAGSVLSFMYDKMVLGYVLTAALCAQETVGAVLCIGAEKKQNKEASSAEQETHSNREI